jgi:hypothetical protein
MAYFIYNKTSNNNIYKIAENDADLSFLDVPENIYLKINATQEDFDSIKLNTKIILPYNGSSVELQSIQTQFTKDNITSYINDLKTQIKYFLIAQPQSGKYSQWSNYYNYLNSLNVNDIIPVGSQFLNSSLEQYIQSTGNPYYSILQIP